MAKVEGRESDSLRGIASISIATELESRLRDLERNIAVAKQFIKLADESYSEVRREWNILQQDLGEKTAESELAKYATSLERKTTERSRRKDSASREKKEAHSAETGQKDFLTKIDAELNRTKVAVPASKEAGGLTNENSPNPKKALRRLRPRPKG